MLDYLLTAACSGLCFTTIGVSIRAANGRGIDPLRVFTILCLGGCGFFIFEAISKSLQWQVLGLGVIAGVTQYAAARLYRVGLSLGPLMPLWCALLLSFLEPVAWAAVVHGVVLSSGQWIAMGLAVAGVICSARMSGGGSAGGSAAGLSLRYLGLLLSMLILNGVANVCLVEVDALGWHALFPLAMVALYAGAALPAWLEARRSPAGDGPGWRAALPWGMLAAAGSIGGMSLLRLCIDGPAGLVFTVQAASSIAGAATAGVFLFRERVTPMWWATIILVLSAVVAAGWPAAIPSP